MEIDVNITTHSRTRIMVDFEESIYKYLNYLSAVKNASEHTLRNYRMDLQRFKDFFQAEGKEEQFELSKVDKRGVRAYIAALTTKNASKKTILRRLSTLRSFFKFHIKEHLLDDNPMDEIDSPKLQKKIPTPLSYESVERLFQQPDLSSYLGFRDRCIMELFYSSGLRISELAGLNRKDIDDRNFCLRVLGKGKKERIVPITQTAAQWIKDYLNHPLRHQDSGEHQAEVDAQAVFLNKWGKRLTVRSIDRRFEEYLKSSGLSGKITPHTIRHTIATHWLEKGMDLKTIQVLLGHSSLATTTLYTQVSSRLKREVYEKAHPLELNRDSIL